MFMIKIDTLITLNSMFDFYIHMVQGEKCRSGDTPLVALCYHRTEQRNHVIYITAL